MPVPAYLRKRQKHDESRFINDNADSYRPLLGAWLIEIALMYELYNQNRHASRGRWPDIFEDDNFCELTGICIDSLVKDYEKPTRQRRHDNVCNETNPPTPALCKAILKKQLKEIRKEELSLDLPLFRNIALLADMIGLSEADQAVLVFAAVLNLFPRFSKSIANFRIRASNQNLCQILATLTALPETEFRIAISESGLLMTSGLIGFSRNCRDLEDKFDLIDSFSNILLTPHENADDLINRFLKRASAPTITLDHFPHLAGEARLIKPYLKNAISEKTIGVNVLLYGPPGVGKSEYVEALAVELGVDLYEISFVDDDGDPIKGERRLRGYNLCQSLLARTNNAMLVFDEVEDVFPGGGSFLRMMFDKSDVGGDSSGKAWINQTLEQNPVPAVWIGNQISHIDPAYLRRFDYSVKFTVPPAPVRRSIAMHHFDCFNPPEAFLERIVANEEMTPGQFDHAAKVARIAGGADNHRALELVEQTLDRSAALLNQKRLPSRNIVRTAYSLDYLNTDADIPAIVAGLKLRPRGTFCYYGSPGTGKSELARYIADQTGKQIMIRRASDIIDKYVGETEKNIAAMFADAYQKEAILVLDEADSFLADRRYSQRNWEVTRVNELLTQMEAFEGVFICTTNLMEKLDPASLRRFDFKVRFDPMTPDQSWRMFQQELVRLGGETSRISEWKQKVSCLEGLTPGDFAVGARQFELMDVSATPAKLYEILLKECQAKGCSLKKIGFESNAVQYVLN